MYPNPVAGLEGFIPNVTILPFKAANFAFSIEFKKIVSFVI